ncbi:hypothetical protein [Rhodophyticola porphyridii]|uniref:hypothetical protein n=1 Tax=Rhodophyticola porphyridii TaxID=1852017 RepID=UPI0035D11325
MELVSASPVSKLADHIEQTELEVPALADEYRYASLPLCVVDAVFSIGVRYTSTQKVVSKLCDYTGWTRFALSRESRGVGQNGLPDLIALFDNLGIEGMADTVFQNRQRTSSRSGILKSEAVLLYCRALTEAGIISFSDFDQERREYAEAMILGLPGQSSGIAFDYFMMLAGDNNLIKPDRMVQRYVGNALKLDAIPQPRQAAILVRLAARVLRKRGHQWSPLSLDHAIWRFQSAKASAKE